MTGQARSWQAPALWVASFFAALVALRHVVSDWRLGASMDLGENGDISVYIGALNFLDGGGALYDYPLEGGYGFTYPPFAAVVLRPLIWLDPLTTGRVWLAASLVAAIVLVSLVVSSRGWPRSVPGRLVVLGLAIGAFLGSVQVQADLITGQVNLFLALLVLLDVGRYVQDRFRGALVGLAAAIKLTPMVVWGWFLLTRQWRALATSVGTFAVCGAVGAVLLPSETRTFWTDAMFDTGRVGDVGLRFNASVMGTLARAGLEGPVRSVLWLAIGGVIVLLAFWNAQSARRAGDHVAAAIILGCAAVIATPIAWPHHQIWLPLAGIVLATRERWVPRVLGLGVLAFAYLHITITRWSDQHGFGLMFDNVDFAMLVGICVLGLAPARSSQKVSS